MARAQMTHTALAEATGIARPNLSEYLAGKSNLRSDSLCRVFAALEIVVVISAR